jgi:drug/metabolite transporter (DMT)-like permease
MNVRVIVVWWIVCILWSSTFLFIKLGLRDIPPFTFAWVRLAIAVAVLAPIAITRRGERRLSVRDVAHVCITGVLLLGLNYGLLFWGTQFVPSGLVAILQSGTPVLALAFGWFLGSEAVNGRKLVAVTLGVVGVVIIFGAEASQSGSTALGGAAAVFLGSVCVAFAYVWLKTHGQHLSRTSVTALQTFAGLVPLACIGLAIEGPPDPARWPTPAWAALLYLALFASVAAFWLNYWLLERMDTSAMLMMGVAEVPVAVALGAVVFGERLPPGTLLGAVCVLTAVLAALIGTKPTGRQDSAQPPVAMPDGVP